MVHLVAFFSSFLHLCVIKSVTRLYPQNEEEEVNTLMKRSSKVNKKCNSKIFNLICSCLEKGKHCHMLFFDPKTGSRICKKGSVFCVRSADAKSPKWNKSDVSLFEDMDAVSPKKRVKNLEQCKNRARANFSKLVESGYFDDLGKTEKKPYTFHKYQIIREPQWDKPLSTVVKKRKARGNDRKNILQKRKKSYGIDIEWNTSSLINSASKLDIEISKKGSNFGAEDTEQLVELISSENSGYQDLNNLEKMVLQGDGVSQISTEGSVENIEMQLVEGSMENIEMQHVEGSMENIEMQHVEGSMENLKMQHVEGSMENIEMQHVEESTGSEIFQFISEMYISNCLNQIAKDENAIAAVEMPKLEGTTNVLNSMGDIHFLNKEKVGQQLPPFQSSFQQPKSCLHDENPKGLNDRIIPVWNGPEILLLDCENNFTYNVESLVLHNLNVNTLDQFKKEELCVGKNDSFARGITGSNDYDPSNEESNNLFPQSEYQENFELNSVFEDGDMMSEKTGKLIGDTDPILSNALAEDNSQEVEFNDGWFEHLDITNNLLGRICG